MLAPGEEHIAAADELLAASLRELVALAELAASASYAALADECRQPLARSSAALVRLLDRALRAHGRDHRYRIDVWQAGMLTMAQAAAAALTDANPEEKPLADTLRRAAGLIADALAALPRDRLGVPEIQTQAASELLVVYVAARET